MDDMSGQQEATHKRSTKKTKPAEVSQSMVTPNKTDDKGKTERTSDKQKSSKLASALKSLFGRGTGDDAEEAPQRARGDKGGYGGVHNTTTENKMGSQPTLDTQHNQSDRNNRYDELGDLGTDSEEDTTEHGDTPGTTQVTTNRSNTEAEWEENHKPNIGVIARAIITVTTMGGVVPEEIWIRADELAKDEPGSEWWAVIKATKSTDRSKRITMDFQAAFTRIAEKHENKAEAPQTHGSQWRGETQDDAHPQLSTMFNNNRTDGRSNAPQGLEHSLDLIKSVIETQRKPEIRFDVHPAKPPELGQLGEASPAILKIARLKRALYDAVAVDAHPAIRDAANELELGHQVETYTEAQWSDVMRVINKTATIKQGGVQTNVMYGVLTAVYGDNEDPSSFMRIATAKANQTNAPLSIACIGSIGKWAQLKTKEDPEAWCSRALARGDMIVGDMCTGEYEARARTLTTACAVIEASATATDGRYYVQLNIGATRLAEIIKIHAVDEWSVALNEDEWKVDASKVEADNFNRLLVRTTKNFIQGNKGPDRGKAAVEYLENLTDAATYCRDYFENESKSDKEGKKRSSKKKNSGTAKTVQVNAATIAETTTGKYLGNPNLKDVPKIPAEEFQEWRGAGACFQYVRLRLAGRDHSTASKQCRSKGCPDDTQHTRSKTVYEEKMNKKGKGKNQTKIVNEVQVEDEQEEESEGEVRRQMKPKLPNDPVNLTPDTPRSKIKGKGGSRNGGGKANSNLVANNVGNNKQPTETIIDSGAGTNVTEEKNIIKGTERTSNIILKAFNNTTSGNNKEAEMHIHLNTTTGKTVTLRTTAIAVPKGTKETIKTLTTEATFTQGAKAIIITTEDGKLIVLPDGEIIAVNHE
ncbi:hypothetical protein TrCOL_g1506, partial [Triparma columacea]